MSLRAREMPEAAASFPRVSGDEPYTPTRYVSPQAFSPRERG